MRLAVILSSSLLFVLSFVFATADTLQRTAHQYDRQYDRWSCKITMGPPCPPTDPTPTPKPTPSPTPTPLLHNETIKQLLHSHLFWQIANKQCRDYGKTEGAQYPVVVTLVIQDAVDPHRIHMTCKQREIVDGQTVYFDIVGMPNDILDVTL